MAKGGLWYPCQACGEMVRHAAGPGDHVLDAGTRLFCPKCGRATEVRFADPDREESGVRARSEPADPAHLTDR